MWVEIRSDETDKSDCFDVFELKIKKEIEKKDYKILDFYLHRDFKDPYVSFELVKYDEYGQLKYFPVKKARIGKSKQGVTFFSEEKCTGWQSRLIFEFFIFFHFK